MATRQPSLAKAKADARPIPLPPPVTTANLLIPAIVVQIGRRLAPVLYGSQRGRPPRASVIEQELLKFGYLFIVAGTILEGDATMIAVGFLAHQGHFRFGLAMTAAAMTTIVASHLYYELGRRGGRVLLDKKIEAAPRMQRVVRWVEGKGVFLMLGARFVVGMRVAIPTVCGATGVARAKFTLANSAGAFIWGGFFGSIGYFGADTLRRLFAHLQTYEWPIAALLVTAMGAYLMWRFRPAR